MLEELKQCVRIIDFNIGLEETILSKIIKRDYLNCDDTFDKRNDNGDLIIKGFFVEINEDADFDEGEIGTEHNGLNGEDYFPVFYCRIWDSAQFNKNMTYFDFSDKEPYDYFCVCEEELDENPSLWEVLHNHIPNSNIK